MSKRTNVPHRRAPGVRLLAALTPLVLAACGLEPEHRIKDPDCDHCYELASGVRYKTFEYYDP